MTEPTDRDRAMAEEWWLDTLDEAVTSDEEFSDLWILINVIARAREEGRQEERRNKPRLTTLSCETALRDLVVAVEMWFYPLPPNIPPALRMARIALDEIQQGRNSRLQNGNKESVDLQNIPHAEPET